MVGAKPGAGMAQANLASGQPQERGSGGGPGWEPQEGQRSAEVLVSSSPQSIVLPAQLLLAL